MGPFPLVSGFIGAFVRYPIYVRECQVGKQVRTGRSDATWLLWLTSRRVSNTLKVLRDRGLGGDKGRSWVG